MASVDLLEERGTTLGYPHTSSVNSSQFGQMRELRIQHKGHPLRVLYAFDPRRVGLLLLGGDKTGDDRWYNRFVPIADKLFARHLAELRE
ncbi:MAG: type II toxin-antitoxin system RelE/ParE family toxin [Gemmatimonadaceae bacterium]